MFLSDLTNLSNEKTYSISPENFSGAKGGACRAETGTGAHFARKLGKGFKISPSVVIKAKEDFVLGEVLGEGMITHIWMTCPVDAWRNLILECYWDDEENPSVQVPVGDFFCNGWCVPVCVNALPISVNPRGGFNSYWSMPFLKRAKIVLRNLHEEDCLVYYQIDYCLKHVGSTPAYFHSQFRRTNPTLDRKPHVILDGVRGRGHYVGTYLAWQANSCDWWGEGQVKFYLDGDEEYPTICSTGTEDYFGGAYNFEEPPGNYKSYSTPFLGLPQVIKPDGLYDSQQRFGMYRFHILDRICFEQELKVTVQALGVRYQQQYLCLKDDIASTAYWYQTEPHEPFPALPDEEERYVSRKIDWTKSKTPPHTADVPWEAAGH